MHVPHSSEGCDLFTQQEFTEYLLSARHSHVLWGSHTEENRFPPRRLQISRETDKYIDHYNVGKLMYGHRAMGSDKMGD